MLEEQDLIYLGLGQSLKLVLRTQPDQMCVMNAFQSASGASAQPKYGLTNLAVVTQYIELTDADQDRILQSSFEFGIPASVPFL